MSWSPKSSCLTAWLLIPSLMRSCRCWRRCLRPGGRGQPSLGDRLRPYRAAGIDVAARGETVAQLEARVAALEEMEDRVIMSGPEHIYRGI